MQTSRAGISERERSDDLWLRDLSHIGTSYGRLVYLAGLRNPDTGRYEYYGSTVNSSGTEANQMLKRRHEAIFREWVSYPLEKKKADIELYIATIDQVDKAELIDAWLRLTPYKNLVPASIRGPERQKHVSDFEAILGLLTNVYGVAYPDA
jgi:ABC-type molybdate transport system ATPase subunit